MKILEVVILPLVLTDLLLFALLDDGGSSDDDQSDQDSDSNTVGTDETGPGPDMSGVAWTSGSGTDNLVMPEDLESDRLENTAVLTDCVDAYDGLQGDDLIIGKGGDVFGGKGADAVYTVNFVADENNVVTLGGGTDVLLATANTTVTDSNPNSDRIDMGLLVDSTSAATTGPSAQVVDVTLTQGSHDDGIFTIVTFAGPSAAGAANGDLSVRLNGVKAAALTANNFTTFTANEGPFNETVVKT